MRTTRQRAQEGRRALIVSGAMLLALAGAAFATLIGTYSSNKLAMLLTVSDEFRGAILTGDLDGTCSLQVFDNRTGRMIRSQQSCETTAYDSNGVPIPTGTIHRLDAISKSFHSP